MKTIFFAIPCNFCYKTATTENHSLISGRPRGVFWELRGAHGGVVCLLLSGAGLPKEKRPQARATVVAGLKSRRSSSPWDPEEVGTSTRCHEILPQRSCSEVPIARSPQPREGKDSWKEAGPRGGSLGAKIVPLWLGFGVQVLGSGHRLLFPSCPLLQGFPRGFPPAQTLLSPTLGSLLLLLLLSLPDAALLRLPGHLERWARW